MKNWMFILVFISLSTVLCNCSSRYTTQSISEDDLLVIAEESLKTTDFKTQYSPDSSFILLSTFEEKGYAPSTTFVVVRLAKEPKAIYNSEFRGDYINWSDISTVVIKEKTGLATHTDNGLKTFEIDVVTGEKKEKNNPNDENKK